ncbi:YybH family protein [Glycomyces xiaoerkulensis]|uniref:YybH family protein n=1 Tax=Glycomyces xiaoerkulensis TaxID=2038139 RepID=UPI000C26B91E|nr:nuclear transport factor 2 family protein [Glycomyces xiaoerkulensis]
MSRTTVTLTDDAAQHPRVFAEAFNSGDPDQVERVYEPDGVLITEHGRALTGAARREANSALLALGLPITVEPRTVSVNGDLALLIVDWEIAGRGADGRRVEVRGTATDVARKGTDGHWRYAIDNPWGTSATTGR